MSTSLNDLSIVQYIPKDEPDSCGYCKTKKGSKKFGMWAFHLTVHDYQNLIDRGWRRCGHYCYKPVLSNSCCALYTIRCDATEFKLTRSQKRVLKRNNYFIKTGEKPRHFSNAITSDDRVVQNVKPLPSSLTAPMDLGARKKPVMGSAVFESRSPQHAHNIKEIPTNEYNTDTSTAIEKTEEQKEAFNFKQSPNYTSPNCASSDNTAGLCEKKQEGQNKSKQMRINRKRNKLIMKGLTEEEISKQMLAKKKYPVVKNVEDFMESSVISPAHMFDVRLIKSSPPCEEFEKSFEESYQLYCKYQIYVHKDDPESLSRESYKRFLVNSPLIEEGDMGSYHQQYWLGDKLIAVGVIDILPNCVSSVYLYYDPEYRFLSLGTYSSLREIFLVRSLAKSNPSLKFYYMGFYIRTCPKMRYKGSFNPSFLLCPEVYSWHPIEKCLPKIDISRYARLNESQTAADDNMGQINNKGLVIFNKKLMTFKDVPVRILTRNCVNDYLKTVGAACGQNIILQLDGYVR